MTRLTASPWALVLLKFSSELAQTQFERRTEPEVRFRFGIWPNRNCKSGSQFEAYIYSQTVHEHLQTRSNVSRGNYFVTILSRSHTIVFTIFVVAIVLLSIIMPEAPDGQASAADFDFYEDVDSSLPIGVTAVTAPPSASSLPHPRLQELRGRPMAPKPKPAKKPAVIVSGVRQSNRNKRKLSNPPSARPPKKAKQTIVEIDSSDGDNSNDQDDTDDEDNEDLGEDDDPSDHLKRLDAMSAQDVLKRKPRV